MKNKFLIPFLLVSSFAALGGESKTYYGDGYTIIEETTTSDDLKHTIYKSLSSKNIGQALIELLNGTGWRLAELPSVEPEIVRLYAQPLADHKRQVGPMSLDSALQWISGSAWDLVVDPVNKLISYELNSQYRCFPSTKKLCVYNERKLFKYQ